MGPITSTVSITITRQVAPATLLISTRRRSCRVEVIAPVDVIAPVIVAAYVNVNATLIVVVDVIVHVDVIAPMIVAAYVEPALAAQRLARVRAGAPSETHFSWAGAQVRGRPHYVRVQRRLFLIERDNSGGNHIHSVWRDVAGDWGRDALAAHYRDARHEH